MKQGSYRQKKTGEKVDLEESRRKLGRKKTTSGNFFNGLQKFEFSRLSQFVFFLFPKFTEPYTYVKP